MKDGTKGKAVGKLDLPASATNAVLNGPLRGAFCGTTARFIAAIPNAVLAFEIPSGKPITSFPVEGWQDTKAKKDYPSAAVACSANGKRVAIRSGTRLTLHDLK